MGARVKALRVVVGMAVGGTSVVALAPAASATVSTVVSGTTFTTTLSAAGSATVTCASNQVQVNGADIGLTCSSTTGMTISGSPSADTINLAGVTDALFPATTNVGVFGGGGNDTITSGGITSIFMAIYGGGGNDHLIGGTGKSTIFGGPGDDTIEGSSYFTSISGDEGYDTIHGGSGYDEITAVIGDLPDAPLTAGTGGGQIDVRARHVWMKGRAGNGCDIVVASDTDAELVSADSGFTSCQSSNVTVPTHDVVVAGVAPATSMDVNTASPGELLDVYTAGPATNDTVNHVITRAGFAPVTYPTYFSGSFALTLHQTYPASASLHAFVHSVFRDLNGQQAPDSQINSTVAAFTTFGTTRQTYTTGRTSTDLWRGLQVDRAFRTFLSRDPDGGGRTYWINRIASGAKIRDLRSNLMASPEFYSDAGSSATGFVNAVYQLVLNRTPDAAGLSYWVGRLNAGEPRSTVSTALLTSAESLNAEVTYQFRYLIGRDPTAAELSTWAPTLRDASDGDRQLQAFLAASNSYLTRAS